MRQCCAMCCAPARALQQYKCALHPSTPTPHMFIYADRRWQRWRRLCCPPRPRHVSGSARRTRRKRQQQQPRGRQHLVSHQLSALSMLAHCTHQCIMVHRATICSPAGPSALPPWGLVPALYLPPPLLGMCVHVCYLPSPPHPPSSPTRCHHGRG